MKRYRIEMWKDHGEYLESLSPQRSEEWHRLRARPTSSDIGVLNGTNRFGSLEDIRLKWSGTPIRIPINEHMTRGIKLEPEARKTMEEYLNSKITGKVQIRESGICISKKYPELGASPDGVIYVDGEESDCCIEIKCPAKPTDRIWPNYYDQMQWHCHVLQKKACVFMMYCPPEIYIETVKYSETYASKLQDLCFDFIKRYSIQIKEI